MPKSKVIEVENISKSYGTGDNIITVLNDISFDIDAGEFVIFFGPSGCGKSTLLNVICGLEAVDSGKVSIRSQDISKLTQGEMAVYRRTKIGIVFQQFNLLKNLSNKGNVALPLLADGQDLKRAENRAEQLLRMFGLDKHINKKPTELSGGQQQRVAMARALASNPWIIIADEPTGNLDSKSADEVIEIFNSLNRQSKRTMIMVTHNPDYLKYADKVIHLKDGKIIKEAHNHRIASVKKVEGFDLKEHALES
jgi:putative ABC transport system ATP-binding protein